MSSIHSQPETSRIGHHTLAIEQVIGGYLAYGTKLSAIPYLCTYNQSFLESYCPEVLHLPAAFIVDEQVDETFIGIHISEDLRQTLESKCDLSELLKSRNGLDAFLILAEEVSHFHYYLHMLDSNKPVSRFDLELQAELDKIIIAAVTMNHTFGQPHLLELIKIVFDQSIVHGTLTDYQHVSKIAEKFWKDNLSTLGPRFIFDTKFRTYFQKASRISGSEKRRLLDQKIEAA